MFMLPEHTFSSSISSTKKAVLLARLLTLTQMRLIPLSVIYSPFLLCTDRFRAVGA